MTSRALLSGLAVLLLGAPAIAQDAGGVSLAPGIGKGPVGLARPLLSAPPPFLTARDLQSGMTPADHQAQNQNMITRLRGDAGYLAGFSFGTPLAPSRQVPVAGEDGGFGFSGHGRHRRPPVIINNEGPLQVINGTGNVVQQQYASGPGPIAQQQVSTTGAAGGGASNVVTRSGNIVQRTP
ncbi:MAG TPA: hypothetical protein VE690_15270 [Rhodopila sp.]|nr:hypothetical protein [Rhodopila sp.]